jgi:hypothetical protein
MANENVPRRLDQALRPGGLYYTADGTAHDAHGNVLKDAPKRPENTPPDKQPAAILAAQSSTTGMPAGFDMRVLGSAIAEGLRQATSGSANAQAMETASDQHAEIADGVKDTQVDSSRPPLGDVSRVTEVGAVPGQPTGTVTDQEAAASAGGAGTAGGGPPVGSVSSTAR